MHIDSMYGLEWISSKLFRNSKHTIRMCWIPIEMDVVFCSQNSSFISKDTTCLNFSSTEDILLATIGPKRRCLAVVVILFIVYSVVFITGIIGNVFTCIVIIRTNHMRTSTNFYLLSLALSDVILLIVGMYPSCFIIFSWGVRNGKCFRRWMQCNVRIYCLQVSYKFCNILIRIVNSALNMFL